ncbi:MAG TPA: PGPGW domain-containing protein [Acidothermaceae bacterium]|nr:PGPGW domain-containing protein [Acidothermaceae bacterium]
MVARLNNTPTWLRRPVVTAVGIVLIAVGIVLLVLPGPGLLVMALGLAVLATEYPAAQRLLDRLKASPPVAAARAQLVRFRTRSQRR